MPFTIDELNIFREGTWLLECPRLRLKQRSTKTNPTSFSGPGDIRLSPDRTLLLRLFGSRVHSRHVQLNRWVEELQQPAGTLAPEDSYYDLEAIDFKGRRWIAKRLRVTDSYAQTGHAIVTAQLPSLSETVPHSLGKEQYRLSLFVFEDFAIPQSAIVRKHTSIAGSRRYTQLSRDAWKFRACGIDFLMTRHSRQQLEINADADRKVVQFLRERIAEALQFLFGRPVPWTVSMEIRAGRLTTELRSRVWLPPNPRHRPPLPPDVPITYGSRQRLTARYHRRLFERFLCHTLSLEQQRHPLGGDLNAVYEASAGRYIDAHALTLTVVIETLLAREFPALGKPSTSLRRATEEARKHIQQQKLPPDVEQRLIGAVSEVLRRTPMGRLRALVRKGAITDVQRKSWSDLRNASTHAYQLQAVSSAQLRELLRINEILFTHLIFHTIGYRGLYMDYSKDGWPLRSYP